MVCVIKKNERLITPPNEKRPGRDFPDAGRRIFLFRPDYFLPKICTGLVVPPPEPGKTGYL